MTYAALERPEDAAAALRRALVLAGDSPLPQFQIARDTLVTLGVPEPAAREAAASGLTPAPGPRSRPDVRRPAPGSRRLPPQACGQGIRPAATRSGGPSVARP